MSEVVAGESITLLAQFYDFMGGSLTDLDATPTITITNIGTASVALAATTVGVTHPATGSYGYEWTPTSSLAAGSYLVEWAGLSSGSPVTATETVTVVAATAPSSTAAPGTVWYASREDVKNALDILETSRAEAQIDRVLRAATMSVEGLLQRKFYPELRTMTFDYPPWNAPLGTPWKLYLNQHELISVTALSSGGTTIPSSAYFLRPDDGPPYTRIELNISSTSAFSAGDTFQRAISVTGLFGYRNDEDPAGTLATTVNDTVTTVDVSDGSLVGVGNLLRLDSERMTVAGRSFIDSGENLAAAVSVDGTSSITVDTGAFSPGEVLLVDAERMLITDVAGTTLVVKRAWDGTTLQAHSNGADVYVSRRLTVRRGVLGTTSASHTSGSLIYVHTPPTLVRDLTIAEAMAALVQERTGYARTIGAGEGEREVRGVGLADLREQALIAFGRRARMRTV